MHFIGKKHLSRRHFLRGAGYAIALPFLDAMIPAMARAATAGPLRVAYLYFPHGTHPEKFSWTPAAYGTSFQFPTGLASSDLVNYRQDLLLVGRLFNYWSQYGIFGDSNNDHAEAVASYLTGMRANWNAPSTSFTLSTQQASANLPVATGARSVDVMISEKIGAGTKIPVLHLTPPGFAPVDAGTIQYSNEYRTYLSWKSPTTPTPRYENPLSAFTALFGAGGTPSPTPSPLDLNARKKSILDLALSQANSLKLKLGPSDNIKLDEYLTSLREVERTIQSTPTTPAPSCTPGTAPASSLTFPQMTKAYLDLIVLAFQCDQTRVASYMMDYELNSRNYSFAGATKYDGHQASHGGFAEDYADAFKIITWYANQFAYLISRMKAVSDAGGTLLSQSILHLGAGENTSSGDHPDEDIPLVIAGQGGGLLTTGRAVNANNARVANFHLSMLQKIGVNATSFGNSNGTIVL